jgi:hypothetical protein
MTFVLPKRLQLLATDGVIAITTHYQTEVINLPIEVK